MNKTVKLVEASEEEQLAYVKPFNTLAEYVANQLFSQGVNIQTDKPELKEYFKEFFDRNQLDRKLWFNEYNLSKYGRVVLFLQKDDEGKTIMNIATPETMQNVEYVFTKGKKAKIYRTVKTEKGGVYFQVETYDEKYITVGYEAKENGVITGKALAELSESYGETGKVRHNFDFMPVFEIFNKPFFRMNARDYTRLKYTHLADWYNASGLNVVINNTFKQMEKELVMNKTRIVGDIKQNYLDKLMKSDSELKTLVDDFFIQANIGADSSINILSADPKFMEYMELLKATLNELYHYSGYSGRDDKQAQQTEQETMYTQKQEIVTTKMKRDWRTRDYTEILKLIIENDLGGEIDHNDWAIEIVDTVVQSRASIVDDSIKMLQAGITDKDSVLQEIHKMTQGEAIAFKKKIDAEQEVEQQKEVELQKELNPEQPKTQEGE